MEPTYRSFGTEWASAVIDGDYTKAQGMLAPWLRKELSPSDLEAMLKHAVNGGPNPAEFELDAGFSTYEDLKNPDGYPPRSNPFDPSLTADNFRKWMCVEFRPSEDDEESGPGFDLWMAVVDVEGSMAIGYLEPSEAD